MLGWKSNGVAMADSVARPGELLKAAKREKARAAGRCLGDYRNVILELRAKKFTWGEVQKWLAERGLSYSKGQIFNVGKSKAKTR